MEFEHEETSVTLGISIPIDSSKKHEMLKEALSVNVQQTDTSIEHLEFSNLTHSLDPNLGMFRQLSPSNISLENSTLNSWNIEPHFLNILPLSSSNENSILVFGGINPSASRKMPPDIDNDDFVLGSTIFQYILDSGIWKYYGTMIEPRCYHASALDGQHLYVTGGYSLLKRKHGEMLAISSTHRLDLNDRHWKSCSNMIMSRAAHALVSHKGYLYAFGGRNSQGSILASVERYDTDQDLWIEITSLPQPTMGLSATCTTDSVWLIGGITDYTSKNPAESLVSNVFSFTPSVKKWCEEVPLPYACAFSSCIANDHALWLIGGCTASTNSRDDTMISCSTVLQLMLSEKLKWKSVASLLYPRHALTAVLYDKYIYIFGGVESANKCASDKIEVINTAESTNSNCIIMPVPIAGCTSVLIISQKDNSSYENIDDILQDYRYIEDASETSPIFSEDTNSKIGVENYYSSDDSKTCSILDDIYNGERSNYMPSISTTHEILTENYKEQTERTTNIPQKSEKTIENPENAEKTTGIFQKTKKTTELPQKTEKTLEAPQNTEKTIEIPRKNVKTIENSQKIEKTIELSEAIKEVEIPVNQEKFSEVIINKENSKEKDDLSFKISQSKANQHFRYRTSMEIFLDSEEIGPYSLKKQSSQALKWLDYLQKLSQSDEKFHKYFLSKEPKINIKSEVGGTEVEKNSKRTEVKYFEEDKNIDFSTSADEQNSLCSQHKSFTYVRSNIKMQHKDLHSDQELKNKKEASKDTAISSITQLDVDNSDSDIFDETKITINEDSFPIIMLIGGEYFTKTNLSRFIMSYYCNGNVWKHTGYIPEYRCYHSAVLVNNKIYIIGGFKSENSKFNENITNKTIYYDIYDKAWHDAAEINYPRAHHSTVLFGDIIYIFGGRDPSGQIIPYVEAYDETNDVWKECESLPYSVLGCASISLNDSIHVFGGITYENDNEVITAKTGVFDTKNNSWFTGFEMPIPLAFCGISKHLNSVFLIGGLKYEEYNLVSSKEIFKYDMLTKTWSKIGELSIPRLSSVIVSIEDKVYVIGGHCTQEKKEVLICELVDTSKNEIYVLKSLPIAVSGKAGIALTKKDTTEINTK